MSSPSAKLHHNANLPLGVIRSSSPLLHTSSLLIIHSLTHGLPGSNIPKSDGSRLRLRLSGQHLEVLLDEAGRVFLGSQLYHSFGDEFVLLTLELGFEFFLGFDQERFLE